MAFQLDIDGDPRSEYFERVLGQASGCRSYDIRHSPHRLRHIGIDRGRARFHALVCKDCDAIFACMVADYRNERYYAAEFRTLESYSSWLELGMPSKTFDWGSTDRRKLDFGDLPRP